MLLWNVNANLLYGAKCIQYFTFLQPKSFAIANGELNPRTMGMIGLDGKKNVWFDYVKVCNEWIMEIDEYLMSSINLGITPIGNISKTLIEGVELIELNSNIFKSVQGSELLIGSFKYYDKDLFFILNNDYENETNIKIDFINKLNVKIIIKGNTQIICDKTLNLNLGKGEAALLLI